MIPAPPQMPGTPTPPMGAPSVGAGTAPGQPPFGSSPAQMPTPDRGLQAAALAQVNVAVQILTRALPLIGASSQAGKEIMRSIQSLSKITPPGTSSPGIEQNALVGLMQAQKADAPQVAALRAMGQEGGPPPMGA